MNPNEEYISKLAYQIWESEGKPQGKAAQHWEQARILAGGEESSVQSSLQQSISDAENENSPEPPQPDQT